MVGGAAPAGREGDRPSALCLMGRPSLLRGSVPPTLWPGPCCQLLVVVVVVVKSPHPPEGFKFLIPCL